jgi:site-specific recombinase XerD
MVIAPQKSPDPSYPTQGGSTYVAPHRKGRIPYPLAPNQPPGQRATRYKAPEVSPQELALLDFLKKLPHEELLALQEQANQPKEPIGPLALEELIKEYITNLSGKGRRPNTLRIYTTDLVTFARFLSTDERDVTEMGYPLLQSYCAYLTKRGYARVSVSRQLTALKHFLVYLRQQGVLDRAQLPAPKMFITKTPKGIPPYLSQEEVARLIEAPDNITLWGIRDRAMVEILYGAGLRVSELVGLNVSDLELQYKTAFIRHGKGDRQRWARYGTPARRALVKYLEEARPEIMQCSRADFTFPSGKEPPRKEPDALFLNRYGERLSVRMVQKIIKIYARLANIDRRVYPHVLRHAFGTHLLEGGADIPVVQHFLGHASPATTQIYTHVTQEEARKALMEHHPRAMEAKEGGEV